RTHFPKLLSFYSKKAISSCLRAYGTRLNKELDVPTFCDIHVDLPYSVNVKPLNVHKYHNCDKLIIQQEGELLEDTLNCYVDGNHVQIEDVGKNDTSVVCNIRAPVKANLYIRSSKDISVGCFNGDKIYLTSYGGNIFLGKYQGNCVKLVTNLGNITLSEFVLASSIEASVSENGSISCGKLQGSKLKLKTANGNITVESSYCDQSEFEIGKGNLDLCNAHKSCEIFLKDGEMNLTCFDGKLSSVLEKGSASIHLSRISDDSQIIIKDGSLALKLSESCQEYSKFMIKSNDCDIGFDSNISTQGGISLIPKIQEESKVVVDCQKGRVSVESVSWQEIMKQTLKK
ncbi:unnamed protein product, partial [Phaedon cochleariae]